MKTARQEDHQIMLLTAILVVIAMLLMVKHHADMKERANAAISGQQLACQQYGMTGEEPDPCDILRAYKPAPDAVEACKQARGHFNAEGWCK